MEKLTIKHYSSDERPIVKGHGFDGLEIGEDREEAEKFIDFINKLISQLDRQNITNAMHSDGECRCSLCGGKYKPIKFECGCGGILTRRR